MKTPFTGAGSSGPARTSALRAPQPGDRDNKNWLKISQLAGGLIGLQSGQQLTQDQLHALKFINRRIIDGFHPFKVYSLPSVLRAEPDVANDWRKFRVRAGRVLSPEDVHDIDVEGTDGADEDPDAETFPDVDDIEVPEDTEEFWIWIAYDASGGTAEIAYSDDPASDGWDDFPAFDSSIIPVAMIDTSTELETHEAIIRQIQRTDVVSSIDDCPFG